jgi:dipeptidyl aminopeptidase/acylaminoacyl peptidase
MSWDTSFIKLLNTKNNTTTTLFDGEKDIAVAQPKFSPDGSRLVFLSDKNGWLNLWSWSPGSVPTILIEDKAEMAYATWSTGASTFDFLDNDHIVFTRSVHGTYSLAVFTIPRKTTTYLNLPNGYYFNITSFKNGNQFCCSFTSYNTNDQVWIVTLNEMKQPTVKVVARSGLIMSPQLTAKFSEPKVIEHPSSNGTAYGLFYPPTNKDAQPLPPVIVFVHGGPTGMATNRYTPMVQYFASRGYAVFCTNHRGSIGYGREYRTALNGAWGTLDVEDSYYGLLYLRKQNKVHPTKAVIMGGSAGGYTTLMSLATKPQVYSAGVNLCGVADLFELAANTHLLEKAYLDILVGFLPQNSKKYYDSSPINFAENIVAPLIVLQGANDTVVPKAHSLMICKKVRGVVEYHEYPGEGHMLSGVEADMWAKIEKFLTTHVLQK